MTIERVGILHPGAMGAAIADTIQNGGAEVWWLPGQRSARTRERGVQLGLRPAASLSEMAAACALVVSVCPPHGAEPLAQAVADAGFSGIFLDANAISPKRARGICRIVEASGSDFLDGGILGVAPAKPGQTRICLSGPRAESVAALFSAGPIVAQCLDGGVGRASALKMCYAGNTKGTRALLAAVLAVAESLGVREDLERQWALEAAGRPEEISRRVQATSPKAWRWVAEMDEIAETFADAGMPREFHRASGEIYRRMTRFRDADPPPGLEEIIETLLKEIP